MSAPHIASAQATLVNHWINNLCQYDLLKPFIYDSRGINICEFPLMQIVCNDMKYWPSIINICNGNERKSELLEFLILEYINPKMPSEDELEENWFEANLPIVFFGLTNTVEQIKARIQQDYGRHIPRGLHLINICDIDVVTKKRTKSNEANCHPLMFKTNEEVLEDVLNLNTGCFIIDFSHCKDSNTLEKYLKLISTLLLKIKPDTKDNFRFLIIGPPHSALYDNKTTASNVQTVDQRLTHLESAIIYHPSSILVQQATERFQTTAMQMEKDH